MNLTDLIARLDLIDKADGLFHHATALVRGRGLWQRIEWLRNVGWTGREVEQELHRFSVPVSGRGFSSKTLFCNVPAEQHRWADYLLRRAGVPMVSAPPDPCNVEWAAGKGPVPQWDGRPPITPSDETEARAQPGQRKASRPRPHGGLLARLLDWLGWD